MRSRAFSLPLAERDELVAMFGCGVHDEYSTEGLTRVAAQCMSLNCPMVRKDEADKRDETS